MGDALPERVADEVEALEAIYDGVRRRLGDGRLEVRVPLPSVAGEAPPLLVRALCPLPGYPEARAATVVVESDGSWAGKRRVLSHLSAWASARAAAMTGDEALFATVEAVREEGFREALAATGCAYPAAAGVAVAAAAGAADAPLGWQLVLSIDHMNRPRPYTGLLRSWARELGLRGRCLLSLGPRAALAANSRVNGVLVVLGGARGACSTFVQRLRTEKVDLDRFGKPCKEKKARVLRNAAAPDGPRWLEGAEDDLLVEELSFPERRAVCERLGVLDLLPSHAAAAGLGGAGGAL